MQAETGIRMARLYVDGGACVSDIMMQFQADISECTVDRPVTVESTALGAAMLAAIGAGLMDMSDLSSLRVSQKIFEPQMTEEERSKKLEKWRKAVKAARIII
jgi:glycerol kinase